MVMATIKVRVHYHWPSVVMSKHVVYVVTWRATISLSLFTSSATNSRANEPQHLMADNRADMNRIGYVDDC